MLTLLLLRHAKAVQHVPDGDHARPLTPGGVAAAERLGSHLADRGLLPDIAYVSGSVRTSQTFDALQIGAKKILSGRSDESLYNASATQMRDMMRHFETASTTTMIVGHNPGIMDLSIALGRDGDLVEMERMRNRFPPCSLSILTFDTDHWRDAGASGGRLDLFVIPEDLVAPS